MARLKDYLYDITEGSAEATKTQEEMMDELMSEMLEEGHNPVQYPSDEDIIEMAKLQGES